MSETTNKTIQMSFGVDDAGNKFEVVDAIARERVAALSEEIEALTNVTVKVLYASAEAFDSSYWTIKNSPTQLQAGVTYTVVFSANSDVALETIQAGPSATKTYMIDTIAENVSIAAGSSFETKYTPSQDGLIYFRTLEAATKFDSINFYTTETTSGGLQKLVDTVDEHEERLTNVEAAQNNPDPVTSEESNYYAGKISRALGEARALKNEVDGAIESLLHLKSENGTEKTTTIKSVGAHKKAFVRVGLHYGAARYGEKDGEIYFDGACKKDFSDVRFFDNQGNLLKAEFGPVVNLELAADSNIDCMLKTTSDGRLVGFKASDGIVISSDNGQTWVAIAGTHNVTSNASDVYLRTSMYPVFVDASNNIFAYAGGIMYKLYASDGYATIKNVCDFSWVNDSGVKVYPDIQNHGMDADINGNLVFGVYQGTDYYHAYVYASTDGGENWTLSSSNSGPGYQHIHHVHADKYSPKLYVGIDDNGGSKDGSRIIVTENGGETWTNITDNFAVRGKDYYPTYFGQGYRLGGGETYLMGSATVYKSVDDANLERVVPGYGGVRSFADWGDDSMIICGVSACNYNPENQILVSYDQGSTWEKIYKKYQAPAEQSGVGYRDIHDAVLLNGDTEHCVLMPRDGGKVNSLRVYKGGNHWYREAYVEVADTLDADFSITAKTGYSVKYPYNCLEGREHNGLVYHIPLNEGAGSLVASEDGTLHAIGGAYSWEHKDEPVRYGNCTATMRKQLFPSSAVHFKSGSHINLGKIDALNFKDNFTISLWFSCKSWLLDDYEYENHRNAIRSIFEFGDARFILTQRRFWFVSGLTYADYSGMRTWTGSSFLYSDDYYNLVVVVKEGVCYVYLNGCLADGRSDGGSFAITSNLSERDFLIGSTRNNESIGYLSDVKIYNRAMEADEILEMYRGW